MQQTRACTLGAHMDGHLQRQPQPHTQGAHIVLAATVDSRLGQHRCSDAHGRVASGALLLGAPDAAVGQVHRVLTGGQRRGCTQQRAQHQHDKDSKNRPGNGLGRSGKGTCGAPTASASPPSTGLHPVRTAQGARRRASKRAAVHARGRAAVDPRCMHAPRTWFVMTSHRPSLASSRKSSSSERHSTDTCAWAAGRARSVLAPCPPGINPL